MLMEARLDTTAVAVGFVLAEHADYETGANARPSHATISEYLGGISSETIRKATSRLETAGLIRKTKKPSNNKATVWRLADPEWAADEEGTPQLTPQATPHVSVGLPSNQITKEEDAPAREPSTSAAAVEIVGVLKDAMDLIDPVEAARAAQSSRVTAQAQRAVEAGRSPDDVLEGWRESVPEDGFDNGPAFAVALLKRVTSGERLPARARPVPRANTQRRPSSAPRTPEDFAGSPTGLCGWDELEVAS